MWWVLSHVEISDNDTTDKAEILATKIILYPATTDLPINYIKSSIKHKIYVMWQYYWESIPLTNKLKTIKENTKMAFSLPPQQTSTDQVAIIRTKIGYFFGTHSFLISKILPPISNKCQTDLSVQHIILNCTMYRNLRINLSIPPNMKGALNDYNTTIIKFLTKTYLTKNFQLCIYLIP